MILLNFGTLPTTKGLALTAKISGTEACEVLDVMTRSLRKFGAHGNGALVEMLKAYGFEWRNDDVRLDVGLQEDVDAVAAAIREGE